MALVHFSRRALLAALPALLTPLQALAQARPPRQVLAFYYGWYGADGHTTLDDAPDHPQDGPYDSLDPAVITRHTVLAKQAGLTGLIASWWGQGDRTDRQLGPLLDACAAQGLAVAPYVEVAASPEALAADIAYLFKAHGDHPAWLRLDGKPVIFLYDRVLQDLGLDGWNAARARVETARPDQLAFIATGNGRGQIAERAPAFDGVHIYDMPYYLAQKHDFAWFWRRHFYASYVKWQKGLRVTTATVMPGFDDRGVSGRTTPRPVVERKDGKTLAELFDAAIAARPDWILVVSFNEWHEGSEIEPSREYGDRELKTCAAMCARFLR